MSIILLGTVWYGLRELNKVNQNAKSLYSDRLFPMEQLTKIRFLYTVDILSLPGKLNNNEISVKKARQLLSKAETTIIVKWKAYKQTYLIPEEIEMIEHVDHLMLIANAGLKKFENGLSHFRNTRIEKTAQEDLDRAIKPILKKIEQLIRLQIKVGKEIHKNSQSVDLKASNRLYTIMTLCFLFTIPFSVYIVKNIKKLRLELKNSNRKITDIGKKYRSLVEQAGDPIFLLNEDTSFNEVNGSLCKLLGYSHDEFLKMKISDVFSKGELERFPLQFEALKKNKSIVSERKWRKKDGTDIDVEINIRLLEGEGYLAIVRDITEQKYLLEQLIENKEQLKLFIDHSPASLAMLDNDLRYIATSKRWINDYNLADQTLIGKTHYEIFPEITEDWKMIHQRCLKGAIEKREEDVFIRKDGTKEWLRWENRPWHKANSEIGGIIMFTEVITERKRATELFKYQFENSPDIILLINKFFIIEAINRTIPGGKPIEELIGKDCVSVLPIESQEKTNEALKRCFETGQNQEIETAMRFGIWVNSRFVPMIMGGEVTHVMIFSTDNTKRKQAEESMTQSEKRLNEAQAIAHLGSWELDFSTGKALWSIEACRIYGINPKENVQSLEVFISFLHEEDRDYVIKSIAKQRQSLTNKSFDHRIVLKDGTVKYIQTESKFKFDDALQPVGLYGIFHDITERKKTEIELENTLLELETRVDERTKELSDKNNSILDSINYAKRIQIGLLSSKSELIQIFPKSFCLSRPCDIVSGDFFWCFERQHKKIIVVADCTGHGVPGALMSIIGNNLLEQLIVDENLENPAEILDIRLKNAVKGDQDEIKDGMDIALCVINTIEQTLQYAGAYNSLFLTDDNNLIQEITANRCSIGGGVHEENKKFETNYCTYLPGQRIYLSSDGYYSQFGGIQGKKFMKSRFIKTLEELQGYSIDQQEEKLTEIFIEWKGENEPVDDVMLVGIEL